MRSLTLRNSGTLKTQLYVKLGSKLLSVLRWFQVRSDGNLAEFFSPRCHRVCQKRHWTWHLRWGFTCLFRPCRGLWRSLKTEAYYISDGYSCSVQRTASCDKVFNDAVLQMEPRRLAQTSWVTWNSYAFCRKATSSYISRICNDSCLKIDAAMFRRLIRYAPTLKVYSHTRDYESLAQLCATFEASQSCIMILSTHYPTAFCIYPSTRVSPTNCVTWHNKFADATVHSCLESILDLH